MSGIKQIFYILASIFVIMFNVDLTFLYELYDYEKYQLRSDWGTVMLPKGWVAQEIDGLAYFIDEATGEIIAEEYFHSITNNIAEGAEHPRGKDRYTHYIYNEKYKDYREKENIMLGGNGYNEARFGESIYLINENEETRQLKFLTFCNDNLNIVKIFIFKDVSEKQLRAILDSYIYPKDA